MDIIDINTLISNSMEKILYEFDMIICNPEIKPIPRHAQITKTEFSYYAMGGNLSRIPLNCIVYITVLDNYFINMKNSLTLSIMIKNTPKIKFDMERFRDSGEISIKQKQNETTRDASKSFIKDSNLQSPRKIRALSISMPKNNDMVQLVIAISGIEKAQNIYCAIKWLKDIHIEIDESLTSNNLLFK